VQFGARGAPGKVVSLLVLEDGQRVSVPGADGQPRKAATDAGGVYRFTGLATGTYTVTYVSQAVPDGNRIPREPNEIGFWSTKPRDVTAAAGARMPPFDVAYNGLIYPATGIQYIVAEGLPLPFHWSTHLQAQKYQLIIYSNGVGREPAFFTSPWSDQPTALFDKNLRSGTYSWEILVDAGDTGEGRALVRRVDMGPPNNPPAGGEEPALP
jgi:hypothetical protein